MEDPNTDMEDAASLLRQLRDSPVTASLGPAGPLLRQLRELTTTPEGVSRDELQNLTKDLEGLCISLLDHSEAKEPLSSMAKSWMSEVRELCYDTKNYLDDAPFISKQDDSGGDDDDDDDAQLTPEEKQEISKLKFKALKDRASHAKDYRIDKPSNRKPKLASTRPRLPVLHPELIDRGRMDKLVAKLPKDEEKQLKVVSVVGLEGVGKTTLVKNFFDDAPFISNQDLDDDAQLTLEEKQEISKLKFKALKDQEISKLKFKELKDRASHHKDDYQIDKPSNRKPKLASTRRRLPVLHPELIDRGRMDKLAALLHKDEKQLKVVSVVGFEGVGKTTLAKRIYHQIKTGGQFECWGFVRVSPNPDMRRLLTTIFKQIQLPYSVSEGVSRSACCLDAQALITSIKAYLRDKRYFIIIDDLWSTSVWDVIRRAFPDGGCHSRIITTTQFKNVASACCSYQSKYIFEMQPLKYDQSRKLFSSMVFGSEDDDRIPEAIQEVASEIIKNCGGLPLSILNIASLLLTEKRDINSKQWMDVRNSFPCTLRRNPTSEGIKEILNLIYNNLSPELKTCLLYLVVHPEGYTVNKGDLVKQWVIEGFIGEGQNKEEIAGRYFDELVSRGMIQAVDINCHGVLSCTLHHTVHNLIVNKSMEENFIISVDYFQSAMGLLDKVRRLSVQLAASRSARIPVGIMMSEVRSLAFFGFYGCVDFIEECKLLRVLILHVWADQDKVPFDLSGIISKLLPLRYVKIACNITVKLPAKIQDLQFLETLEVDTPVVSIPSDIGGLGRLSSLQIAVTELSREDIRILQKLRALTALSLHVCTTLVKMIVFDKEGFLVLKSFKFRCHLPWLKFEEGSMPDLRNLNLCFNAREADQHGIVPIGMEHLSCLEEITADIWGADADVGSTFRTAISNHPKNPRIYMQLVDPVVHGDATRSVGTIKVEDEKKQAASDSRMSKKRMSTLPGSSSQVPVQGVEKKLRLEIETDGIEVKAETFGYGREETAHRMSIQKIKTENIDDKPETKFVIPEGMDIEYCTPSSPMKTESIEDKLQTKFDILEDEKKPADIRVSNSPGSSSRVPDSGADKRSKLKTETDNQTETDFESFDDRVVEPRMTTSGEFVKLFQWIRSAISSQYSGCREQELQVEVSELEKRLHGLRGTLPETYVLINAAEWRSYEHSIDDDDILQNLKVEVYDAEDLLDEFKWYELKVTVEGNANQCPFSDFFSDFITGSFNEKVQCIQDRLDDLLNQLEKMGLHEDSYESVRRFDKSVRPETTYLLNESEIFGRDMELKKVIGFLTEPKKSSGARSKCKSANKDNDEPKIPGLHVLPIVGIGGVGKTCLAQHVCNHPDIRSHFNLIIWICVSDDFDVMRLTKQALESCPGEGPTSDDLGILQDALSEHVRDKKVLIILDDLWGNAFKESGKYWKTFCAPLKHIGQKSLMLVTTRSPMVADRVRTMRAFTLQSLKGDAFWNFFKLCAFESESSNNDPNFERIGMRILSKLKRSILSKLDGSPLAAQTVALQLNTCSSAEDKASHWKDVLESELWKLTQKKTDILPSLQLSYMHLPLHLKRCFDLCAVYPKGKTFENESLAEIWVAEGFVEPEGKTPAKDIACRYFEELVNESFFRQDYSGSYIIPHLLHDMAKLVSENDCFIIREKADFGKVPGDVRHLTILSWEDIDHANLLSLCNHTKLRTLLYSNHWVSKDISAVIGHWCRGFHRLRVMCCGSTNELPDSIGSLKHLRYLEITGACPLNSLPSAFCYLYSLQTVYARECKLETMGGDFSKLISLRRFKSHGFDYSPGCVLKIDLVDWKGLGLGFINNVLSDVKCLRLRNLGKISKNQAAELELKNKQRLKSLKLTWGRSAGDRDREVLQALEPPTSLKSLLIREYRGVSLPSFVGFRCLKELVVDGCPNINSQCLVAPSLKRLVLGSRVSTGITSPSFGNLADNIDCCSLDRFKLTCPALTSIQQQNWTLPALQELEISWCRSLRSIGQSGPTMLNPFVCGGTGSSIRGRFSSLTSLRIISCGQLSSIDNLLSEDYLPVIQKIHVQCSKLVSLPVEIGSLSSLRSLGIGYCPSLVSLPVEIGSLSSLHSLEITYCPSIRWPSGFVFPSSLQCLELSESGDMSACVPSCLENLTSLVSLTLSKCPGITVIPEKVWSGIRKSLQQLSITDCPDLVSIGGARAIQKLRAVTIEDCPNMEDIKQPRKRGRFNNDLWEGKSTWA